MNKYGLFINHHLERIKKHLEVNKEENEPIVTSYYKCHDIFVERGAITFCNIDTGLLETLPFIQAGKDLAYCKHSKNLRCIVYSIMSMAFLVVNYVITKSDSKEYHLSIYKYITSTGEETVEHYIEKENREDEL